MNPFRVAARRLDTRRRVTRLSAELLEDRSVPASLVFVDDNWAGTTVGTDPDGAGPATSFGTDAFDTIQSALDNVDFGGIVVVNPGTYAEALTITKGVTLTGATGIAADVVINPPGASAGITVNVNSAVNLQNLTVTDGTFGVLTTNVTALNITNVVSQANTTGGLQLAGVAGSSLVLSGVSSLNNQGAGLIVDGFGTDSITDLTLTGNTAVSAINPGSSPNSTVNFTTSAGVVNDIVTASGTSLQLTRSSITPVVNDLITLASVTNLNLFSDAGVDAFQITPSSSTAISIDAGAPDVGGTGKDTLTLDLTGVTGTQVPSNFTTAGFAGTATFNGLQPVTFSRIESLTNGQTINGVVFNDLNGNGTRESNEQALAGVVVQLDVNSDGTVDMVATTDANGAYSFTGLLPGSYTVKSVVGTGQVATTVATSITATLGGSSTVNLGLFNLATISGLVFNDVNNNGTLDVGESGSTGVTVQLDRGADGSIDATTTTDANGNYSFANLEPGVYRVRVVLSGSQQLTTALPADITTTSGTTVSTNFGIGLVTSPPPPIASGGTVRGVVFADLNGNGVRDSGEVGLAKFAVFLDLNDNGKLDRNEPSTVTGADGSYALTVTTNGTYHVLAGKKVGYITATNSPLVVLSGGADVTANLGLKTNLPDQATPSKRFAVGVVIGGIPYVRLYNGDGSVSTELPAFNFNIPGGVRVALGDVNGDGVDDIVLGTGPGVATVVRVLDGKTGQQLFQVQPFEAGFTGGVYVAVADINGDGKADVIVTPDQGGGPVVAIYDGTRIVSGTTGEAAQLIRFFGINDPNFRGGARVAVADINGDGFAELIVAAGFLGGPRVTIWDGASVAAGNPVELANFFVFEQTLRNGVFIGAGDLNGDGIADIAFGGGPGGGPRVRIASGKGLLNMDRVTELDEAAATPGLQLANFFAGDINNRGGVRVAFRDLDGDGLADLLAGSGENTAGRVAAYTAKKLLNGETQSRDFDIETGSGLLNGAFVG